MAFEATRPTDDRFSPKPDGFGWSRVQYTITNGGGDTGGTIANVPFSSENGITIASWTPTTVSTHPTISASRNATTGMVDVVFTCAAGVDGELILCGRGM